MARSPSTPESGISRRPKLVAIELIGLAMAVVGVWLLASGHVLALAAIASGVQLLRHPV